MLELYPHIVDFTEADVRRDKPGLISEFGHHWNHLNAPPHYRLLWFSTTSELVLEKCGAGGSRQTDLPFRICHLGVPDGAYEVIGYCARSANDSGLDAAVGQLLTGWWDHEIHPLGLSWLHSTVTAHNLTAPLS